jgi:hypothetical protein
MFREVEPKFELVWSKKEDERLCCYLTWARGLEEPVGEDA